MKIKLFLLSIWGYVLCRCVIQDFELRLQFRCVPWNCRQMQPQFWSQTSQKPWHYGWSHGCIVFICCGVMIVRKLTASRFSSFVSTVEVVCVPWLLYLVLWILYLPLCYAALSLSSYGKAVLCFTGHENFVIYPFGVLLSVVEKCHHCYSRDIIKGFSCNTLCTKGLESRAISGPATHCLTFEVCCRIAWMGSLSESDQIQSFLL